MRKTVYVSLLSVALLVGIVFGVAAQNDFTTLFSPFVVDIEQSAPVEVSVIVPMESGEIITATVPMTVSIALRVSVEGPNMATVNLLDKADPVVSINEAEIESQLVDASGTPYVVEAPESLTVLQAQSTKDRYGNYVIIGEVENTGNSAIKYGKAIVTLYDAQGQIVVVETTYLHIDNLEPGKKSTFEARFGDKVAGIGSYSIRLTAN